MFKSSLAVIIGFILFALILLIGSIRFDQDIWNALIALGTCSAVIVAVFYPFIHQKIQRPRLEIGLFESEPPHLRQTDLTEDGKPTGKILYPLSISLTNKGNMVAKQAQPQVTSMAKMINNRWEIQNNWIPAPIRWGLDEPTVKATHRPTEEKDLVPERPYFFNFAAMRTDFPDYFFLNPIVMPGGQQTAYSPGEFCFELTIYAEGAKPKTKYFHIHWDGGCCEDFEDVKKRIKIDVIDNPPWQ